MIAITFSLGVGNQNSRRAVEPEMVTSSLTPRFCENSMYPVVLFLCIC